MNQRIEMLPLSALFESANNPRKTFNEASLVEMADTMRAVGVQQPLKVRPLPMIEGAAHFTYEIVFGHRRYRAAQLAGLEHVPCMVEDLTDQEADKIRLIENIQREDVSPVEEADALVRLQQEHNIKPDELGKILGISRTAVYNQMKLATAHPKVREQCQAGVFGGEIATKLARLPLSVQPIALKKILTQQPDPTKGPQGTKMVALATREASQVLKGQFTKRLEDAEFDTAQTLGACGPCNQCDKRSDNVEALLADLGAGVCTDMECFDQKGAEHAKLRVEQARQAGIRVIEGEEALKLMPQPYSSYMDGFTRASHINAYVRDEGGEYKMYHFEDLVELAGDQAPTASLLVSPHDPSKVYEVLTDAQATLLKSFAPKPAAAASTGVDGDDDDDEDDNEDQDPALSPEEEMVGRHYAWMRIKRAIMLAAADAERTPTDIRLIVLCMAEMADELPELVIEAMGWKPEDIPQSYGAYMPWLVGRVEQMSPQELGKLALLLALDNAPFHGQANHRQVKLELARTYGVDVLQAGAEPVAEAEEPTAPKEGPTLALDLEEPSQPDNVKPTLKPTLKPTAPGRVTAKYRNAATDETWSGRGLQPKWLQVALAAGKKLVDFDTSGPPADEPPDDAGLAESDKEQREVTA